MTPTDPAPVSESGDQYVGRFAPSPTGPLHLGSLVSALGSWADARHHDGQWLVRVEDIDPQRETPEATQQIIDSLLAHGLQPDGEISFQRNHSERYDAALDTLRQQHRLYACTCTRKSLRALNSTTYPGTCRTRQHCETDLALRVVIDDAVITFNDELHGCVSENVSATTGDFIVRRRGPFYAYQLAVVVDDAAQKVTHVVRGSDLLDNTARQIALQQLLGHPQPSYLHLPLVIDSSGRKLSKQSGAEGLIDNDALDNLSAAWELLGQVLPDPRATSCKSFLAHCRAHWDRSRVPVPS